MNTLFALVGLILFLALLGAGYYGYVHMEDGKKSKHSKHHKKYVPPYPTPEIPLK